MPREKTAGFVSFATARGGGLIYHSGVRFFAAPVAVITVATVTVVTATTVTATVAAVVTLPPPSPPSPPSPSSPSPQLKPKHRNSAPTPERANA
ncbi:MAG: hypothetical protein OXU62_04240 [Gammaproteobacteria bacterium]|nr:hypothetical protein [Gammaproteobacteria bacterium]